MALTDSQKTSLLFKQFFGKAETEETKPYFEEPKPGRPIVFSSQVWSDVDDIPTTAPSLTDGQESGVVKYFEKANFTAISGISDGYFLSDLVDAIPASFGDGSYAPVLYKSDGTTQIFNGENDWVLNEAAGTLYFYGGNPSSVSTSLLPKISFYKYIGTKGGGGGGGASITVSDSAPTDPTSGALWYNSSSGELLVYYNDGDTAQWVSSSTGSGGLWNYDVSTTIIENAFGSGVTVSGILSGDLRSTGSAPASATATGTAGDIRYDADYIYVCVSTNTWKRVAISTW